MPIGNVSDLEIFAENQIEDPTQTQPPSEKKLTAKVEQAPEP